MRKTIALMFGVIMLVLIASCSSGSPAMTDPVADDASRDLFNNRTEDELGVAVAPQMMLLSSLQGSVSVHTYIPYGRVNKSSLTLDHVPVWWTKADSCGRLVAYFHEDEIKSIITPTEELMTLRGEYTTGESFEGSDTVNVKE